MPAPAPSAAPNHHRRLLMAVLGVALILRLALTGHGGQFFFGDEDRHTRGVALYQALRHGDFTGVRTALIQPGHVGFILLGAGITGLQHLGAQLTPHHDWRQPENVIFTYRIGAGWLALFSVLNIWLVHRLCRRAGAGAAEAGWAALLMACSNTGFYYARHFLPYDAALSFALGALWAGLDRRSFTAGLLVGTCYHLYNGYWHLVPVVLALPLLAAAPDRGRLRPLLVAGAGAALAVTAPMAIGLALAGRSYWQGVRAFSGTVNQGLYAEGWSLPWEFFWHSEGLLGLVILLGIAWALVAAARSGRSPEWRAWLWLGIIAMSYAWLVLFSLGLEKFVVYARTVKPWVPFFCLAGGWAAARLLTNRPRVARWLATGCCITAAAHFAPHFSRTFPSEVEIKILRDLGNPKHTLSVSGSLYAPLALPVRRPDLVLANAQLLYPVRDFIGYPAGLTVLSVEHPLAYPPFQYESHSPRERTLLRTHDIRIRLIKLTQPDQIPDDLPPWLRFTASDRPDGRRG